MVAALTRARGGARVPAVPGRGARGARHREPGGVRARGGALGGRGAARARRADGLRERPCRGLGPRCPCGSGPASRRRLNDSMIVRPSGRWPSRSGRARWWCCRRVGRTPRWPRRCSRRSAAGSAGSPTAAPRRSGRSRPAPRTGPAPRAEQGERRVRVARAATRSSPARRPPGRCAAAGDRARRRGGGRHRRALGGAWRGGGARRSGPTLVGAALAAGGGAACGAGRRRCPAWPARIAATTPATRATSTSTPRSAAIAGPRRGRAAGSGRGRWRPACPEPEPVRRCGCRAHRSGHRPGPAPRRRPAATAASASRACAAVGGRPVRPPSSHMITAVRAPARCGGCTSRRRPCAAARRRCRRARTAAALDRRVEGGAEREHVRGGGRRPARGPPRGQERRGAGDQAGAGQLHLVDGPGDAEVGELDQPVVGDEHVARLHIAVHHPGRVRRGQPVGHLAARSSAASPRQHGPCSPRAPGQRPRRQVLHHQPRPVVVHDHVEHADHVRVLQPGADPALTQDPLPRLLQRVRCRRRWAAQRRPAAP